MDERLIAFKRLLDIMDDLREKCPWDKKQTIQSLRKLTIEETYELADAILEEDYKGIEEEVGDVMLHMVFYAKIGQEKNIFDIASALNRISDKLIYRHPHIYGDVEVADEEEVKRNWEELKLKEGGGNKTVLGGVPKSLPAMVKAYRMQEKTGQVGFEWKEKSQVWEKVEEEILELKEVLEKKWTKDKLEDEFGDVFFSLINFARYLDIDPEMALERVNKKFKARFDYVESNANKKLTNMSLEEMDVLWNEAKMKL